ncbi:MAG: ABC transporter permease [Blautia sp.]|nr:ABC transporter permease [Lachnoclostridium sp.]MCM1212087.1 ABC transporter permease [Blautia sp.]
MMKYKTLLRANLKSQKGSFAGIGILVLIITVSLCAVLSIWKNANAYEEAQLERIGYGQITYWLLGGFDRDNLLAQLQGMEDVEKAEMQEIVTCDTYVVYGTDEMTEVSGTLQMVEWGNPQYDYAIYRSDLTGMNPAPEGLEDGEIYVSPAFTSLYNVQIGDRIEIPVAEGEEKEIYTIKGYFEDAVEGSALMGIKQALMTEGDLERLAARIDAAGEKALAQNAVMVHVFQKADSDLKPAEFSEVLNEKTDLSKIPGFSYSRSAIKGFMLILQNLFAGFLMVFVLVLLIVAIIVIGHNISSSIEQDYVDMGILKAVGYTQADLRIVQMLQYLAVVVCGILPGIPLSALAVRGINRLTVPVVGLFIPADIPVGESVLSLVALLLLILGFVCVKTAKIANITPIRAIRGGAEDIYFKSRFLAPIHQKGLSFWLAYRQLVSGKKQYLSVVFVSALLVFFLSLIVRMGAWLGPDGKGLMDSFTASSYDLGIIYTDESLREEVEELMETEAGIQDVYQFTRSRAFLNQVDYLINVCSTAEYFHILEGRTCRYQNEIVVTDLVAEELGISIGDMVTVSSFGKELDFIICGVYQCANDMGANFALTKEAYEQFAVEEAKQISYWNFYLLENTSLVDEMIETLQNTYGEQLELDENTWSGTDAIVAAASSMMMFMFVVAIIFILVTVSMTGGKILYKEQRDMGIYKSLGFVSAKLRLAFSLRFGMAGTAGSLLGMALSAYLTDPLATAMLKICGIGRFTSNLTLFRMLLPVAAVGVLFLVFAYLLAGKVKRVEVGILIVE